MACEVSIAGISRRSFQAAKKKKVRAVSFEPNCWNELVQFFESGASVCISSQVKTATNETGPTEVHVTRNSLIKASHRQFSVDDRLVSESPTDPVISVNEVIATAVGTTVTLVTKVIRAGVVQPRTKNDKQTGRDLKLTEYIIADRTGKIRLVSWEDNLRLMLNWPPTKDQCICLLGETAE